MADVFNEELALCSRKKISGSVTKLDANGPFVSATT